MECTAVVVAAGRGTRFGGTGNKVFEPLGGRPLLAHALRAFDAAERVAAIVVVAHADDRAPVERAIAAARIRKPAAVVEGGARRFDSVRAGARAASGSSALLAIHDAARPLVKPDLIDRAIAAASASRGAVVALPAFDTVKRSRDGALVDATLPRQEIFLAQTPQVFPRGPFLAALDAAAASFEEFTDDAAVAERAGIPVAIVRGDASNVKVTEPADLARAEALLAAQEAERAGARPPEFRVGTGFDVHRLVAGRRCVLGGVEIASDRGPLGHSDGDALLHALGDALLGAAGLDDLGTLFPDTEPRFAGADSRELLTEVVARVRAAGFAVVNADCVLVLERPKIAPHRGAIRASIARLLGVGADRVNVKGKTAEGLGALGVAEAVAANCTVLVRWDPRPTPSS